MEVLVEGFVVINYVDIGIVVVLDGFGIVYYFEWDGVDELLV